MNRKNCMITVGEVWQNWKWNHWWLLLNLAMKYSIWDNFLNDGAIRLEERVVAFCKKCEWADYLCFKQRCLWLQNVKMAGCISVICVVTFNCGKTEKVSGWHSPFYFVIWIKGPFTWSYICPWASSYKCMVIFWTNALWYRQALVVGIHPQTKMFDARVSCLWNFS